ncbi:amidase signature domain-containing protein [Xylariaceae sp. FL0016]|nr:amidase signature domain-containing protein [Xylariaceae sp. FL0016]
MAGVATPTSEMKAAQIVEFKKPYRLTNVAIPRVKDDELLVKVRAAGFCHSDLQVLNGQFGTRLPLIPSHEPAGVIVEVGAKCKGNFQVGDRVGVLNFKKACTECTGCGLSKREYGYYEPRYCDNREMAGFQHDGAFAEFMTADPETTVLLPRSLSFEQAAPLMCAGATVWGALEKATAGLAPGDSIAIVGVGGLGHLGVQFAKGMGYRTIAIDNLVEGRQLAQEVPSSELQPDLVVDSAASDATEQVYRFTDNEGIAAAVVCTDSLEVNAWALRLLRIGGTLILLGLPPERWHFDSDIIVFRELVIRGSYVASRASTERMLEVVDRCKIRSHLTLVPFDELPSIVRKDNPVKKGHAEEVLKRIGVIIDPKDSDDYHNLLAAVHDCAEHVMDLPDYEPKPDLKSYPRENIHRPSQDEQAFGAAWAHKCFIKGNTRGCLKGKTVCLKDCIAVAEVPQFYGSDAFPAWTPDTDATVVTRVLDAGADVHGTAVCENFCNSTSSFTSAQGIVENPHAEGYSAGGSTSGGAALVSSGLIDIAIGTDQGGSIRVPSSLCGCVGLKATHGLVPYTGITSGDAIDDHAGPLTRSVLQAAECMDAIAGYDGIDDRSLGAGEHGSFKFAKYLESGTDSMPRLDGIRIGMLTEGFEQSIVQPDVREVVRAAALKMEKLGAVVEEVSIPLHLEGPAIWTIQQRISGTAVILGQTHGRRGLYLTKFEQTRLPWNAQSFSKLFPSTKNTVINGLYLSERFPGLYGKSVNISRQIRDDYEAALRKFDVLVMPTTPYVAPKHGSRESPRSCFEPSIGLTTNTAVFNVTGHPAMTIPVGVAPAKEDRSVLLPVGMQIVGGLWQEQTILKIGHAWESNFNWKAQRPQSELLQQTMATKRYTSDEPLDEKRFDELERRLYSLLQM